MFKAILPILSILLITTSYAQPGLNNNLIDYHKVIHKKCPGFTIIHKMKNDSSRWEYLGTVKSTNGKTLYHVVTEFTRLRAAIVLHGNSWLLFFNNKEQLKAVYDIGMPDELPYKLANNKLYFNSGRTKIKTGNVLISDELPKMLCALDCYELQLK